MYDSRKYLQLNNLIIIAKKKKNLSMLTEQNRFKSRNEKETGKLNAYGGVSNQ